MSTDYDQIHEEYAAAAGLVEGLIEVNDVFNLIGDKLKDARVLELACGTGRYTEQLLMRGAKHVTAVDRSVLQISECKTAVTSDKLTYVIADCSVPQVFGGGDYDLVIGGFFVDALDKKQLEGTFKLIALNLKPGGSVYLTTMPASSDVSASLTHYEKIPVREKGISVRFADRGETDGGRKHYLRFIVDAKLIIEYEVFWLTRETIESCAKAAGLGQKKYVHHEARLPLDWLPDSPEQQIAKYGSVLDMGLVEEWRLHPTYSIIEIQK